MTVGELARMFKAERGLDVDLQVIRMEGWRRADFFDATGLRWVNPSPNMRSLTEALLYPGIGLVETTNLSVGRGTATPFERFGAPWIDQHKLAQRLNAAGLPGVRFEPLVFTPEASRYKGEACHGVAITLTDRRAFRPVRTGLTVAHALRALYPREWKVDDCDRLLRNRAVLDAIRRGESVAALESLFQSALADFRARRSRFLLYP
jgi:uncharacterized protein YbbC (DUF1343 family)